MSESSVKELKGTSSAVVEKEAQEKKVLKYDEPLPPEYWPKVDHLITEDDTPVDNIFSERQQRLLVESLYASWHPKGEKRSFVALANVGLFYAIHEQPLVPDMLLSLDVKLPEDIWKKHNRSYFVWVYGKPPDVVVEVVSNTRGEEDGRKLHIYARIRVAYYVIFDPEKHLKQGVLRIYKLIGNDYELIDGYWMENIGLGVTLHNGEYEGFKGTWLRWYDKNGKLILTGTEQNEKERQEAEAAKKQAEAAEKQAEAAEKQAEAAEKQAEAAEKKSEAAEKKSEEERMKNERLLARLKKMGINPDEI
jgi:Uma2 family endonuclease